MHPQHRLRLAAALTAGAALAGAVGVWAWQRRLPAEVVTLQAVLERLSRSNDLGSQPIHVMVSAGSTAAQLAEQRGLCKPQQCDLFAQLNPYQHYGNGWDELNRQAYAMGDIEGWSTSSGTVILPRAAFRAYGTHIDYLSCTVAHEIAHVLRHHVFAQSYHDSHRLSHLPTAQAQRASLARSRQLELEADRDAATMLVRAGFKGRVCLDDLSFLYRSIGDGSRTDPDSTHPGFEERTAAMAAHYKALAQQPPQPQPRRAGRFAYNAADNLLRFTPSSR